MNKYLPLLIASFVTMAFVAVKKSVITALPGINKIIKTCPSESDVHTKQRLKPGDNQVKEIYLKKDYLARFLFISSYSVQNNKKQDHRPKNSYIGYRFYELPKLECNQ